MKYHLLTEDGTEVEEREVALAFTVDPPPGGAVRVTVDDPSGEALAALTAALGLEEQP